MKSIPTGISEKTATYEILPLHEFLRELKSQRIVYLGENHFNPDHNANALSLFNRLQEGPFAVAFEDLITQEEIDLLAKGQLTEEEFLSRNDHFCYFDLLKKALQISNAYAIGSEKNSNKQMGFKLVEIIQEQEMILPILVIAGFSHLVSGTEIPIPKFVENGLGLKGPIIVQYYPPDGSFLLNKEHQLANNLYNTLKGYQKPIIIKNKSPDYKLDYILIGKI